MLKESYGYYTANIAWSNAYQRFMNAAIPLVLSYLS